MKTQIQKIVVTGFLNHQGKVLIIRRAKHEKFLPGHYELPGGKVNFGEDPETALKREFLEEVNLAIEIIRPYRVFSYLFEKKAIHTIEIVYGVKLVDDPGRIKLGRDHDDYLWVAKDEVDSYLQITDEIFRSIEQGFRLPANHGR